MPCACPSELYSSIMHHASCIVLKLPPSQRSNAYPGPILPLWVSLVNVQRFANSMPCTSAEKRAVHCGAR
ncbi:hypothetical protein CONPUDRAFT_93908 [Coniophora puteana RWD-64-598 SS2]|uniref:Uncharacterized protein n=1 Tax=Coniophora puteana (strain RWD-64-598) TaxID=741705 RepID=R7SEU0_CONPW|nr:uncharacterized protein CONPUDRAFT_93908 [Coniophora puteana RWD-64-598 SS2]EIW74390.1 hypothetical protein CONPUDRAFT_93908 [Coniophora puteana RWD-64-598 SS2]